MIIINLLHVFFTTTPQVLKGNGPASLIGIKMNIVLLQTSPRFTCSLLSLQRRDSSSSLCMVRKKAARRRRALTHAPFFLYMNRTTAMSAAMCTTTTKITTATNNVAAAMLLMMTMHMTTAITFPGIGAGQIRRGG
jgi:hypothetical protein